MTSPAPINRDIGARAFMFSMPSWIGPSTAYSVSAVAIEPMICCSRVTKPRQERRLRRVDGVAPAVGREVVARDGEDAGARMRGVQVVDGGHLVGRAAWPAA